MKADKVKNFSAAICIFFVFLGANKLFAANIAVDRLNLKQGFIPGGQHLDLRDLGCEAADLIPSDESAVTSLAEGLDGKIYGGTTGRACHLFVFSPLLNRVKNLGKIDGHQSIHHSLVVAADGSIYFGTALNELDQYPISEPQPGNSGIIKALWSDIEKRYSKYEGGHLYKFDPSKEKREWIDPQELCQAEDKGVPVPHNGIYAMTINNELKEIYGITYPNGHFFVYKMDTGKFTDVGETYKEKVFCGPDNRSLRGISRALVCDNNGFVYGSADDGAIFRYDPKKAKIENLPVKIPAIYHSVVEVFTKDENGVIYGGTSEGYLFRFEPEKMKVANLGKPYAQSRIRGLALGKGGLLYGAAGERTDHCPIFSYNIPEAEFANLGVLKVVREPYYIWVGLQLDAMLAANDGVIYIGESERMSHLFIYCP